MSFAEIAAHAGMEHSKLRGQFGSFTKMLIRHGGGAWPLTVDWSGRDQSYYTMTAKNAELWKATAN